VSDAEFATPAFMNPDEIARGLFPHQIAGIAFLLRRRRAILADDMGLGKTRQAIRALKIEEPLGPYLVVCPASVKRNWVREIDLAVAGASTRILGLGDDRATLPGADWVVINYDILKKYEQRLAETSWRGVILDEAHYVHNHKAQRSRSVRRIVDALEDPVVYMLTGTPLLNRPRDLFPLLQLAKHPLGRSFLSYAKRYCAARRNDFGWVTDGASNLGELTVQLQGLFLRRTKDEVLDLPRKMRTWLSVDVPPGTAIEETWQVLRLLLASQGIRFAGAPTDDAGGLKGRARLIATLTKLRRKLAVAKVRHTIEFVEGAVAQGEKAIVFSSFDEPVQTIHKHFGAASVMLTGATPTRRRQALVDRFQHDDSVRVFVANLVAGGVGLNLTAATQVVFNDLDWVPANHWQAEDRAYRIGQSKTVNVTYLVAEGTPDDFAASVLARKAALIRAVVDGEALQDDSGDVLSELERHLRALSPRLADTAPHELGVDGFSALLREAADRVRGAEVAVGASHRGTPDSDARRRAIALLQEALIAPVTTRYEVQSTSGSGSVYELVVDGAGDVECSCPGFEYRGSCRHARHLKEALATGQAPPDGFERV
jgi:SWI/SNF-related matrix-associated actin-dependent regulator 1 of chromatin subfamily A